MATPYQKSHGGSLAIAGFLYQFIHNIDRILQASIRPAGLPQGAVTVVLEPSDADAIYCGLTTEFVQYKIRRNRAWSPRQILLEVLPPLVRAAMACETPAQIRFVTSGTIANAPTLRRLLREIDRRSTSPGTTIRMGRRRWSADEIHAAVCAAIGVEGSLRPRVAALLANTILEETTEPEIQQRVLAELQRVTGTSERAQAAYERLIARIMTLSRKPGAQIDPKQLLTEAGLDHRTLAPIRQFSRRLAALARHGTKGVGYEASYDIRPHIVPPAGLTLVSGESGSGKTWAAAAAINAAATRENDAIYVNRAHSLRHLREQIVSTVWTDALARRDAPTLGNLSRELCFVLGEPDERRFVVAVDQLEGGTESLDEIIRHDWASDGIALVLAVTPQQAAHAREIDPDLAVRDLGRFSQPELRELLARHGADWKKLPDDVRGWLSWPIMAGLYARLATDTPGWSPDDEYALLDAFAARADARGAIGGITGCRTAIAALGKSFLGHGYPLKTGKVPKAKIEALFRANWLRHDGRGGIEFAHDRLLAWAAGEALSDYPAERFVQTFLVIANFRAGASHLAHGSLGYAIMDAIWLLSEHPDAQHVLERLLDEIDATENWPLRESLYRNLLTTGGESLLRVLLPSLIARLTKEDDEQSTDFLARVCLFNFAAKLGRPVPDLVRLLLRHTSPIVNAIGFKLLEHHPDPKMLKALLDRHHGLCEADIAHNGVSPAHRLAREVCHATLIASATHNPETLARLFDTDVLSPALASALDLLLACPVIGHAIWDRHGERILLHFGDDQAQRYVLARCIDAFSDWRALPQLRDWCRHDEGNGSYAWSALCRLDPESAVTELEHIPGHSLVIDAHRWLTMLLSPTMRGVFDRIRAVLRDRDPTGSLFCRVLSFHADHLDEGDIIWVAGRLDEALTAQSGQNDILLDRLFGLLSMIASPDRLDRLPDLIPPTLAIRTADYLIARLPKLSAGHHLAIGKATRLLRLIDGPQADRIALAKLQHTNDTARRSAIATLGFHDIETVTPGLLAIIADGGDTPLRCSAMEILAGHDPDWAAAHIHACLARGSRHDINEAFWIAQKLGTNLFVDDGLQRLDKAFADRPWHKELVEYLIAHGAGIDRLVPMLDAELGKSSQDDLWLFMQLLNSRTAEARDVIAAEFELRWNRGDRFTMTDIIFWACIYDAEDERWETFSRRLIAGHGPTTLRHTAYFYRLAAKFGDGPAYDILITDAYPSEWRSWRRNIRAISALGANDPEIAEQALRSLVALFPPRDREVGAFAAEASRLAFPGAIDALLDSIETWPTDPILALLSRLPRKALADLRPRIEAPMNDVKPSTRRVALLAAPWSGLQIPEASYSDVSEEVRVAAGVAGYWQHTLGTADRLLERLDTAPAATRQTAAALIGLEARSDHAQVVDWSAFHARLPRAMRTLLWAVPDTA